MRHVFAIFGKSVWGTPLEVWLRAIAVALLVIVSLGALKLLLRRSVQRKSGRRQSHVDDVIASALRSTRSFFYVGVGIWAGSEYVELSAKAARWLRTGVTLVVLAQVGLWAAVCVQYLSEVWGRQRGDDGGTRTLATAIAFVSKLAIWSVLFVMALSSMGFEISALIAGLGVGGVAAALAVQSLLGELLASLAMFFDRPFDLGDSISVDGETGTVERIGLRSTRLRAIGGEELIFSNSDLIKSRIHNWQRMRQRRVLFIVGVDHGTSSAQLAEIPGIIKSAIERREGVRFERAHFSGYGQLSLDFELVYHVLSTDFTLHMDHRQAILLDVLERFRERGIELARQPSAVSLRDPAAGAKK